MQYYIKRIDNKKFEFNIVNCDTCKIYMDDYLIGRYNFKENAYFPVVDDYNLNFFKKLTKRQQKLVLLTANKYFLKVYENIYHSKIIVGEFFAPTEENLKHQKYYIDNINRLKDNIKSICKEV